MDSMDNAAKVRMMVALGAFVDEDLLNDEGWEQRKTGWDGSMNDFLIEKSKNVKSPLNLTRLAEEFKEISGASERIPCLIGRIRSFRSKIHHMNSIDTEMKVKLMFALGASTDMDFLNEEGWNRMKSLRSLEDGSRKPAPKTPGSLKRVAPEVPSPGDSPRFLRFRGEEAGPPMPLHQYLQMDEAPGFESEDALRDPIDPMDPIAPFPQDAPDFEFGDALRVPTIHEFLIHSKSEADHALKAAGAPEAARPYFPRGVPTRPRSQEDRAPGEKICQIKFLEAVQSLVLFLGIHHPEIHQKIRQKIQDIDGFTMIQRNEVTLTLELLVARIVNHSVPNLVEHVKSVSLKEFLCYLKAAILNSKLEGLDFLLEKIGEHIREPDSKDKSIPEEKVTSALQTTLDVIGF